MKISILGYGSFGKAIAHILEKNNNEIIKEEILDSEVIFITLPSFAIEEVLFKFKNQIEKQKIVVCSKGFAKDGRLLSLVIKEILPNNSIYFLYGPTLAEGLERDDFSAFVLAGDEEKEEIKELIKSPNIYLELSDDIIGVQVGATFKNVVNIFIGIIKGAKVGENTEAFVYTKGLENIKKLGISLGAKEESFLGLTCAGDLYLHSRSRELGMRIGEGKSFEEVDKELIYPKEGIATLKNLENISKYTNADLSYFRLIYDIIFEDMKIEDAIKKIR